MHKPSFSAFNFAAFASASGFGLKKEKPPMAILGGAFFAGAGVSFKTGSGSGAGGSGLGAATGLGAGGAIFAAISACFSAAILAFSRRISAAFSSSALRFAICAASASAIAFAYISKFRYHQN